MFYFLIYFILNCILLLSFILNIFKVNVFQFVKNTHYLYYLNKCKFTCMFYTFFIQITNTFLEPKIK